MSIKNIGSRVVKLKKAKETFMRQQTELNLKKWIGLSTYMARPYQEIKSAIRPIHTWINKKQYSPNRKVKMNAERRKLLNRVVRMIVKAKPKRYDVKEEAQMIYVDASYDWLGISDGKNGITLSTKLDNHIFIKELKAIRAGVKKTSGNTIIYSDSQAAIAAVANGTTKDAKPQNIIDEIWQISRDEERSIAIRWIESENNPADKPSREIASEQLKPRSEKVNPREFIKFQWEKRRFKNRMFHKDERKYLHTKYLRKKSHIDLMNLPLKRATHILGKLDGKSRRRILDRIDRVNWANNRLTRFVRSSIC